MAKKDIVWTQTAVKQRREIFRYWSKRNGSNLFALKLIKVISKQIKIIEKHPEAYKEIDFENIRESAFGHFSLYYRVSNDQIIVMAFWDNRQDPENLLKQLT